MMAKFRKKPVVIEAFQMTEERRKSNVDWPEWLHRAWNAEVTHGECTPGSIHTEDWPNSKGDDRLIVHTKEGCMTVSWDDWIIQGVQGELYPCKPDIFEATYEAVE